MSSPRLFNGAWRDSFPPGWSAVEHHHPHSWEILTVLLGSVEMNLPDRKYEGGVGSVFILPPRVLHREVAISSEGLKMTGIYLKGLAVRERMPDQMYDSSGRVSQVVQWMCDLQVSQGFELSVFDDLSRVILFECGRGKDALGDPRMERVQSFIQRANRDEISVEKLAEIAALSRRQFSREFQRRFQMTPMTYVRKVRVEKARRALIHTSMSLREIAHEVGFRDEFEFSRTFRRILGHAPSSLRRKPGSPG